METATNRTVLYCWKTRLQAGCPDGNGLPPDWCLRASRAGMRLLGLGGGSDNTKIFAARTSLGLPDAFSRKPMEAIRSDICSVHRYDCQGQGKL